MKEDVLKNLEQVKQLFTTVRVSQQANPVNLYLSNAENLTYNKTRLISIEHDQLLQTIKALTSLDNQRVNHLFVQFFCLAYDHSGHLKTVHSTLCHDNLTKKIYLASSSPSLFDDHILLNFASREKQGFFQINNTKFFFLSAEDFPELEIAHSEHLFMKYLKDNRNLISDFLNSHGIGLNWQIEKIGINFYSSLDSCDNCQNTLLDFFNSNSSFTKQMRVDLKKLGYKIPNTLSWQIIFFSEVPCKKSSYMALNKNVSTPFKFDKEKGVFILKDFPEERFSFPCEIHALELKTLSEQLMVSQILTR